MKQIEKDETLRVYHSIYICIHIYIHTRVERTRLPREVGQFRERFT